MIDGFGAAKVRAHLERISTEARPFDDGLGRGVLATARRKAREHVAKAEGIGARCLLDGDPEYPESLRDLEHPPVGIWVMGDISVVSGASTISIVGTRGLTTYGERITRSLANAFARCGATVISGMARGIDSIAHRAALESGGKTAAVLGTGVDVPYPAAHRPLHRQIRGAGVVISEAPPGTAAGPGCFPRRNRLIAALGRATIVVEAGVKSGALNTAEWAEVIGRDVAVVPGPIDSAASLGSNLRLRDGGAHAIVTVEDALALIGLSEPGKSLATFDDPAQRAVWKALERPAANFDVLTARSGLPARLCLETVTALELRGLVDCALTGEVRRRN